ncbi:MAG: hypothetical protein IPJ19_20530 [Planctomycetes bacterium]|nr:hypothetical protein [Planctomycetota bacterium]
MLVRLLLALCALALAPQTPRAPQRPRDPWVQRCNLDGRPRMVVFALDADMYCAYDAQLCSFFAAWKGGLAGSGSELSIEGKRYTSGFDDHTWEVYQAGKIVAADVRWGGYWMHDGVCTLLYEVFLPDHTHFQVRETPEFNRPEELFNEEQLGDFVLFQGDDGLRRSFFAAGLPQDVRVCIRMAFSGARGKFVEAMERENPDSREGWVVLEPGKPLNNALLFWKAEESK